MKNLRLPVIVILFCTVPLFSQNINIPDANFLNALISGGVDLNDDGLISYAEAETVHRLHVEEVSISDLTGIEAFTNLDTLHCYYNDLTILDISNNNALKYLNCSGNDLTSLDVSEKAALTYLNCADNQLTNLDVSNNTLLTKLYCGDNYFTSLDISNNAGLTHLSCGGNDLTDLDLSKNSLLEELQCGCISVYIFGCDAETRRNRIPSLDISANINLRVLKCNGNELSALDVSNNTVLIELSCRMNNISSLTGLNSTALTELDCSENQISDLDLSNNTALTDLFCEANELTSLDVSNNPALTRLFCGNNQLSSLNVSNNTLLKYIFCNDNELAGIDISKNIDLLALHCNSNQLTSLNLSNNVSLTTFACYQHLWCSIGLFASNLNISNMPSLSQVCVWESFNPESIIIDTSKSPSVYFTEDCTSGVEQCSQGGISIYPNPVNNLLIIEAFKPEHYSIEINSLNGQMICSMKMDGTTQEIDLSGYSKGIYIVTVKSKEYIRTEKVVKY